MLIFVVIDWPVSRGVLSLVLINGRSLSKLTKPEICCCGFINVIQKSRVNIECGKNSVRKRIKLFNCMTTVGRS